MYWICSSFLFADVFNQSSDGTNLFKTNTLFNKFSKQHYIEPPNLYHSTMGKVDKHPLKMERSVIVHASEVRAVRYRTEFMGQLSKLLYFWNWIEALVLRYHRSWTRNEAWNCHTNKCTIIRMEWVNHFYPKVALLRTMEISVFMQFKGFWFFGFFFFLPLDYKIFGMTLKVSINTYILSTPFKSSYI